MLQIMALRREKYASTTQEMKQTTRIVKIGPNKVASVCFALGKHGSVLRLKAWIFKRGLTVWFISRKEVKETPCSIPGKEIPKLACS